MLQHRLRGRRDPYYLVQVDGDAGDRTLPLYLDGSERLEEGDLLPVRIANRDGWRITRIDPITNGEREGPLARIHVVPADN